MDRGGGTSMTDESDRRVTADAAAGTIHTQYDWTETNPSIAVIETVAVAVDREPTELELLYDFIDPDAFDILVQTSGSEAVTVSFHYASQQVTVHGTGDVIVRPTG